MIQRIFHPIGQGAFYSERHENINIVYDCGNWRNSKLSDKVVTQSFKEDDVIDLLFISHFDFDHISKIPTLKNHVKEIKRVVLPLLHENEKNILSNIFRILNFDLLTLISNPQEYFGIDTRIIYVNPTENNEGIMNESVEPQIIDDIPKNDKNTIVIESGNAITLNRSKDWVFIPFNYEFKKRSTNLITELQKEGFDCERLKSDSSYTLDEIIKDVKLTKREGGKKFKIIYDKLEGKINQNSMLLYSGPLTKINQLKKVSYCNPLRYCRSSLYRLAYDKVGCIYTGDTDLKIVNIVNIFNFCWDNVGTIQIPHHGDIKSFNNKILNNHYCCPISVGTNNTYGHPSNDVIGEILVKQSWPILVTERLDSLYIEIIQ